MKLIRIADGDSSSYKSCEELGKARRTGKEFGEGKWGFSEYPLPEMPKGLGDTLVHAIAGGVLFDHGYCSQDTVSVLVDAPKPRGSRKKT